MNLDVIKLPGSLVIKPALTLKKGWWVKADEENGRSSGRCRECEQLMDAAHASLIRPTEQLLCKVPIITCCMFWRSTGPFRVSTRALFDWSDDLGHNALGHYLIWVWACVFVLK
ncbi:hypothetical protein MRB53_000453 [Persea americana]|uniref:Uncharacterized protein n=1 Tax=Persea americana TaxID=3435 RepID=A0ACC2MP55_PERAE|nr:hypothetical protein MRB53_000453 [Persea americana]